MPQYFFVPGCNTNKRNKTSDSNETKRPSLFSAPKDPEDLKIWNRAIPRADRDLTIKDVVCELHFSDECIEREYKTPLADGTTFCLARGKPLLIKGSVPTIFPGLPFYLSSNKKKRKPPMQRRSVEKKIKADLFDETSICDQNITQELNFHDLMQFIISLNMPSAWWCKNFLENYIALVCWDDNCVILKKIIFVRNLNIKIFLQEHLVKVEKFSKLNNLDDVQNILKIAGFLI